LGWLTDQTGFPDRVCRESRGEMEVQDVSAGIRRHHFGRFWCCQRRRRGPAGTPHHRWPDRAPATMSRVYSVLEEIKPCIIPPAPQQELERWRTAMAGYEVGRSDYQAGALVGVVVVSTLRYSTWQCRQRAGSSSTRA
jgi:hypothetical protein